MCSACNSSWISSNPPGPGRRAPPRADGRRRRAGRRPPGRHPRDVARGAGRRAGPHLDLEFPGDADDRQRRDAGRIPRRPHRMAGRHSTGAVLRGVRRARPSVCWPCRRRPAAPAGRYEITYTVQSRRDPAVQARSTVTVTVLPAWKLGFLVEDKPEFVIAGQSYHATVAPAQPGQCAGGLDAQYAEREPIMALPSTSSRQPPPWRPDRACR